jgi:hypothetical protein
MKHSDLRKYLSFPTLQQQIMDNYFQIKFDVRKIIEVAVRELKEEREVEKRDMTGFDQQKVVPLKIKQHIFDTIKFKIKSENTLKKSN